MQRAPLADRVASVMASDLTETADLMDTADL